MPDAFWTEHPICATIIVLALIGCSAYCGCCQKADSNKAIKKE